MNVYMIDAERIGSMVNHEQKIDKERCFVEASSMAGAIELRPESIGKFEIVSIIKIGNIVAREDTSKK